MNKFDFYLPCDGYVDDPTIIHPFEFENFLEYYIHPLIRTYPLPMVFWNEVTHGEGDEFYHLSIVIPDTINPNKLLTLIKTVALYAKNFQTGPIMWNDQENCGVLTKDEGE